MKKISFYTTLILVIINVFTPFAVSFDWQNNIKIKEKIVQAEDCSILSAVWDPAGEQDKDNFYREGVEAKIVFKTKNCVDKTGINLSIYEADTCPIANCDNALVDSGLSRREIKIPTDNFTLKIKLGEEKCESGATGSIGYDCHLYFIVRNFDNEIYDSRKFNSGDIFYECDGACDKNAALSGVIPQGTDTQPINDEVTTINAKKALEDKNTYKLLAPIGNFTEINTSGGTCPGNPDIDNGVGCYLNIIFKIAIGLCGALAVIMIVLAGIEYMGTESIFGKTEAKSKIFSALMGLFIALGAYAILNTINPDLTGKNGVSVDQVEATIERTSGGGYYGVDVGAPKAGNPNATKNVTTYDSFLKSASQKYGLQCTLVKAFMYAESGGVNGLTSPAGAKGLIQLMPATFKEQGYDVSKMMDPETNIMAGASYLSKLKSTSCNGKPSSSVCNSSNIQFLAASYNGGPRANKESNNCKGMTAWQCTANSGYKETRIYAPRVEANFNRLTEKGWGC